MIEIINPRDVDVVRTAQAPSPTIVLASVFQKAFDHMNHVLFEDHSPPCLITLRAKGKAAGYYSAAKFVSADGVTKLDEIALNSRSFHTQGVREVVSTLVHEMVHQLQHHYGRPLRNGYHDRQWGTAMKRIGLWPSHTGKFGGRETGVHMSHYIIENGPFAIAFEQLDASIEWGDVLAQDQERPAPKPKRLKFVCPACSFNVLAVPSGEGRIGCIPCGSMMVAA